MSRTCRVWCDADAVQLFELDSTDIMPEHWIRIADEIIRRYDDYDGFVIAHGTDTMAYTASALSYLIQNSRKPIVLTGAQKPIGFETTDSKQNLSDSFLCAASGMAGVLVVFGGQVLLGTRARKTRARAFPPSPARIIRRWQRFRTDAWRCILIRPRGRRTSAGRWIPRWGFSS